MNSAWELRQVAESKHGKLDSGLPNRHNNLKVVDDENIWKRIEMKISSHVPFLLFATLPSRRPAHEKEVAGILSKIG